MSSGHYSCTWAFLYTWSIEVVGEVLVLKWYGNMHDSSATFRSNRHKLYLDIQRIRVHLKEVTLLVRLQSQDNIGASQNINRKKLNRHHEIATQGQEKYKTRSEEHIQCDDIVFLPLTTRVTHQHYLRHHTPHQHFIPTLKLCTHIMYHVLSTNRLIIAMRQHATTHFFINEFLISNIIYIE